MQHAIHNTVCAQFAYELYESEFQSNLRILDPTSTRSPFNPCRCLKLQRFAPLFHIDHEKFVPLHKCNIFKVVCFFFPSFAGNYSIMLKESPDRKFASFDTSLSALKKVNLLRVVAKLQTSVLIENKLNVFCFFQSSQIILKILEIKHNADDNSLCCCCCSLNDYPYGFRQIQEEI